MSAPRPVLITTAHKGVFCGLIDADQDLAATSMPLRNARMAIYWNTTRGIMELAHVGPNSGSKISAPADIAMLNDITAVFDVTADAWRAWQDAK